MLDTFLNSTMFEALATVWVSPAQECSPHTAIPSMGKLRTLRINGLRTSMALLLRVDLKSFAAKAGKGVGIHSLKPLPSKY